MYEVRHGDGVTVVKGVGELGREELARIAAVAGQARHGGRMVVIDLKRVTHLHYAGAALLKAIPGLRAAGAVALRARPGAGRRRRRLRGAVRRRRGGCTRRVNEFRHATVLAREAVELLRPGPGRVVLDGTLGGGGHAELLLAEGATVIGIDRDPRAVAAATARLARYGEAFRAVRADFRDAPGVLAALGLSGVDGALVDLGVSSPQLDDPSRGFSFREAGPLDMRMGAEGETVGELLARADEEELARIIATYGEEPFARRIARALKRAVGALGPGEALDTARLAELVAAAVPRKAWPRRIHPATRTFQALRIAVNDELGALAAWLDSLPTVLEVGRPRRRPSPSTRWRTGW